MKTILVTGATDGIGLDTARKLARLGHRIVLHGRNRPRVESAVATLQAELPQATLLSVTADLGKFESVRSAAKQIGEQIESLDVLINNAGVFCHERLLTSDGCELTQQVNHYSHFLLTQLLTPLLADDARVINVSSMAHTRGELRKADMTFEQDFTGYTAYAASKLCNVLHASHLATLRPNWRVFSLHPGVISTKLLREGFGARGASIDDGSRTSVMLASEAVDAPSGSYFAEGRSTPPSKIAQDIDNQKWLWDHSLRITGA